MEKTVKNGLTYPNVPRSDELAEGLADRSGAQSRATQERKAGGRGIPRGARDIPSAGGRSRKGSTKLTHEVREALPVSDKLKRQARFMRKRTCTELARDVGAGKCGIVASALVLIASEDLALRAAALESGNVDLAQRLGVSARGHLLSAREVAAKDAEVRPQEGDDWVEKTRNELQARAAARKAGATDAQ
jgi:hypothetical protein